MRKYRAAIIGCGRIGSEFDKKPIRRIASSHAGGYFIHPRTDLVAACDTNPAKLGAFKKRWKVDSVYFDYKEMLKREKIDILSICTPVDTHLMFVQHATKFPVEAIYCEKPIAQNLTNARKIVKLCEEKKLLLVVNHQRRFNQFYKELRQKISSGAIGKVQHVNCYYTRGIYNTGIHIVDLFSFFFGKVEWVEAYKSRNRSHFRDDPNLDGIIKFKNGPLVTLKACDDSYYLILEIEILTTKAMLRIGNKFDYFQASSGKNLLGKKELMKVKNSSSKYTYDKFGMVSLNSGVEHIINCLEKKERPLSTGRNAIEALSVIETMLLSVKNRKRYSVRY